jgi:hypothetical protein
MTTAGSETFANQIHYEPSTHCWRYYYTTHPEGIATLKSEITDKATLQKLQDSATALEIKATLACDRLNESQKAFATLILFRLLKDFGVKFDNVIIRSGNVVPNSGFHLLICACPGYFSAYELKSVFFNDLANEEFLVEKIECSQFLHGFRFTIAQRPDKKKRKITREDTTEDPGKRHRK